MSVETPQSTADMELVCETTMTVVEAVRAGGGPFTTGDISNRTGMSVSRVRWALGQLRTKGYVEREKTYGNQSNIWHANDLILTAEFRQYADLEGDIARYPYTEMEASIEDELRDRLDDSNGRIYVTARKLLDDGLADDPCVKNHAGSVGMAIRVIDRERADLDASKWSQSTWCVETVGVEQ